MRALKTISDNISDIKWGKNTIRKELFMQGGKEREGVRMGRSRGDSQSQSDRYFAEISKWKEMGRSMRGFHSTRNT